MTELYLLFGASLISLAASVLFWRSARLLRARALVLHSDVRRLLLLGGKLTGWQGVSDDEHRALGIKVSEALDEYHRHYPHQNPHQSARQTAGEGERAGEPEPRS